MGATNSLIYQKDEIIEASLNKLGILPDGGSASTNQKAHAAYVLDALIKRFDAQIFNQWYQQAASETVSFTGAVDTSKALATDVKSVEAASWVESGTETALISMNIRQFANYEDKSTTGTPKYYYVSTDAVDATIYLLPPPTNNGDVKLWPRIKARYGSAGSDSTTDIGFPEEWTWYLILKLAAELADDYGMFEKAQWLHSKVKEEFAQIMGTERVVPKEAIQDKE